MAPRKRDPAFLRIALLAGTGGTLAIVLSIGIPIWSWRHGQPYNPAFSLFSAWGVAALGGAYACVKTYFVSDGAPRRPPRGGLPLTVLRSPTPARYEPDRAADRRAA